MNIAYRSTGKFVALAITAAISISSAALAQEGQQPVCAPGTVYKYDSCEPIDAAAPASQKPAQSLAALQAAHSSAASAHALKSQTAAPYARQVKPAPSHATTNRPEKGST